MTLFEYRQLVRTGRYTSVGGYPKFLVTSCGSALCWDCGAAPGPNRWHILNSIAHNLNDGWEVEESSVNWENHELWCDTCSTLIEAAYE